TTLFRSLLPVVKPAIYSGFPSWFETIFHSGISSAAVVAVLLNLLFNELKLGNPPAGESSVFASAPPRFVPIEALEQLRGRLHEGDVVRDGKIVDASGVEVPCVTASGQVVESPVID